MADNGDSSDSAGQAEENTVFTTSTGPVRIITAASLFDGHDAAINIMRRIIQATGCEVIHLGHDRSVEEVVNCAIEEDANAIAMTSYQGGHTEYLKYMYDLLQEKKATHIKIFAGGGGTILPEEIKDSISFNLLIVLSSVTFDLISGKKIQGSWGGGAYPDQDIPKFAELYRLGKLPLQKMITTIYKLEQINEAIDDLKSGKVIRPIIEIDKRIRNAIS